MNLILITNDYPFGKKESYIEPELELSAAFFNRINIITSSKFKDSRNTPSNITVHKIRRSYKFLTCFLYAFISLLKKQTRFEIKKMACYFGHLNVLKSIFKAYMKEHRFYLYMQNNLNNSQDTLLYSYWLNESVLPLIKYSKKHKMPVISRAHGYEVRYKESYIPFRQTIEDSINEIFFISDQGKRQYFEMINFFNLKENEQCIKTVSKLGTINVSDYVKDNKNPQKLVIVSSSLVYPLKRLDLIIDIIKRTEKLLPDIKIEWHHFGDGPEFESIKSSALNNLKRSKVIFHGQVNNKYLINFYRKNYVDLFINTSDSEGIPVSIMEAESFGIPIIARNVGGVSEIVNSNIGLLIDSNSNEEIIDIASKYIKKLASFNEKELLLLRKTVRIFWQSNYNAFMNFDVFFRYLLKKYHK